jgi:outer membrane lipoprotein carrier protein
VRPVAAWKRVVAVAACFLSGAVAAADAPSTALDRFLDGLSTWKADFTQVVTDAHSRKIGEGQGRLSIARPGRFRWELSPKGGPEAGQVLVADGRNLWFFDRDLEQVTVKPQSDALAQSPAMLLSGAGDVRKSFDVKAEPPSKDAARGIDWVAVSPRASEGDFRVARLGFKGTDLVRMELQDRLGQRTVIDFSRPMRNGPLPPDEMRFVPPAGADVIGKPQT